MPILVHFEDGGTAGTLLVISPKSQKLNHFSISPKLVNEASCL